MCKYDGRYFAHIEPVVELLIYIRPRNPQGAKTMIL